MVGDGLMFTLGRLYGERISKLPGFRKILTPDRFASAQDAFQKYGKWVMFVARFLPGLRTPVFFSAGMSRRVSFAIWFFMDGFAALISVPIWVYLGYFGAQNWDWMFGVLRQFQHGIFALLGIGLVWLGWRWWRKRQATAAAKASGDAS
jgi:membrane protein DedA with SNARE-associated domain